MPDPAQLVVGFDLDMTLIDTRPGFAATLSVLAEETGTVLDVEDLSNRLGPPLDLMLAPHYPAEDLPGLVARFRAHYPAHAIAPTGTFPGAHAALDAVRRHGGRSVVVTGKYRPNAALHLEALDLDADALVGEVWGSARARCWSSTARASTSVTTSMTSRVPARPGRSACRC
ncbi:HAD family hydrolase [Nocardioides panacis]|uniref:HAD family hydrolase n=1 Tax=Nocardioides panacis TaxID=2849501 RepID=UPI0020B34274|nr:HAD hydrolase-like protein [Nocardioides panacis]